MASLARYFLYFEHMGPKKVKAPPKTVGTGTDKDIDRALADIKMKFGDDSIMKLGETPKVDINAIPTGSIGVDWALGIGGFSPGRILAVFCPGSFGHNTNWFQL